MRRIRTFGLAVAMALALTALLGAGTASATQFRAEEYPTSVTGVQSGEHNFQTELYQQGKYNLWCKTATLSGKMSEASSTLTLTPAYSNCKLFGMTTSKIKVNSCQYVFHSTNEEAPFTGTLDIACSKEGDAIEFLSSTNCLLKFPSQKSLGSVSLTNTGKKGHNRTITASLSLTGFKYTELGASCPAAGAHESGTYIGTYVLNGYEAPEGFPEEKEPIGIYLANEQVVVPPLVESEKYPTVVDGFLAEGATMWIHMPGSNIPVGFECSSIGKGQGLLFEASKELSQKFRKWTGCYWGGGFTISMNGCSFVLNPLVSDWPYTTGSLGITCPGGNEITFKLPFGGCKVGIPAQSGLSVVTTENVGTGSSSKVEVDLDVEGLTYTQVGPEGFCNPGTHSDGSLGGAWSLTGYEYFESGSEVEGEIEYDEGDQLGIWVE